jgi:hypothetical protein
MDLRNVNDSIMDHLLRFESLERLKIFNIENEIELRLANKLAQSIRSLKEVIVRLSNFVD